MFFIVGSDKVKVTTNASGNKVLLTCWEDEMGQTTLAIEPHIAKQIAQELIKCADKIKGNNHEA